MRSRGDLINARARAGGRWADLCARQQHKGTPKAVRHVLNQPIADARKAYDEALAEEAAWRPEMTEAQFADEVIKRRNPMNRDDLEKMAREAVAGRDGAPLSAMDVLDLLIEVANKMNDECVESVEQHAQAAEYLTNVTGEELFDSLKTRFSELRAPK